MIQRPSQIYFEMASVLWNGFYLKYEVRNFHKSFYFNIFDNLLFHISRRRNPKLFVKKFPEGVHIVIPNHLAYFLD